MKATELLHHDHETVEGLFSKFEDKTDRALKTRRSLVDEMITELAVHSAIEEVAFYPAVRELGKETESDVLEDLEEHHVVKWLLTELDGRDPDDERFVAKTKVLMETVRHHVEEEEGELFPVVEQHMGSEQLDELGSELERLKDAVPERPHPRAPDTPPGNVVAAIGAIVTDTMKSIGREVAGAAKR